MNATANRTVAAIAEPGIYTMPATDYHADPCPEPSLSSSIAQILCSSTPAHARLEHPRLTPDRVREEAEHFDVGTAAHSLLLEGVNGVQVLDYPDWRTNAAKAARDAARAAGKVPLLRKVWDEVEAMTAATRAQLDAHRDGRHMFRDGRPEQVLVWREGTVWCRARLDWLRLEASAIDDYKSTKKDGGANPEKLSRTLFEHGWDVQAAFYARGFKALTGRDVAFRFAVQECFAPYALSVVALGPAAMMLAEKKVQYAIEVWGACLADDHWPTYADQTAYVSLPPWIESAWLEREVRDEVGR